MNWRDSLFVYLSAFLIAAASTLSFVSSGAFSVFWNIVVPFLVASAFILIYRYISHKPMSIALTLITLGIGTFLVLPIVSIFSLIFQIALPSIPGNAAVADYGTEIDIVTHLGLFGGVGALIVGLYFFIFHSPRAHQKRQRQGEKYEHGDKGKLHPEKLRNSS